MSASCRTLDATIRAKALAHYSSRSRLVSPGTVRERTSPGSNFCLSRGLAKKKIYSSKWTRFNLQMQCRVTAKNALDMKSNL